jgi:hypothetical protein
MDQVKVGEIKLFNDEEPDICRQIPELGVLVALGGRGHNNINMSRMTENGQE